MNMLMNHWLECVGVLHQVTASMLRLVRNGPDGVLQIRMASGRVLMAAADEWITA